LDVTKRKESEEALSSFNRKMIQVQEQERICIARELHDDIGQRVALLAIALEQLGEISASVSDDFAAPNHQDAKRGRGAFDQHPQFVARFTLFMLGLLGGSCSYANLVQGVQQKAQNGHSVREPGHS
jgi:hypothetical protein